MQSKDSLAVKKESSEGSGLLSSIDHNVTDAHTGYNVHREALNEAAVISGDQFQLFWPFTLQIYSFLRYPMLIYVDRHHS